MKLYVCKVVNHGSLEVVAETSNEQTALVNFHNECKVLWNAPEVLTAMVKILDENMDNYQGKMEYITHEPAPAPEPEPEPEYESEPDPEIEP